MAEERLKAKEKRTEKKGGTRVSRVLPGEEEATIRSSVGRTHPHTSLLLSLLSDSCLPETKRRNNVSIPRIHSASCDNFLPRLPFAHPLIKRRRTSRESLITGRWKLKEASIDFLSATRINEIWWRVAKRREQWRTRGFLVPKDSQGIVHSARFHYLKAGDMSNKKPTRSARYVRFILSFRHVNIDATL